VKYLPQLDSLRALAVAGVVVYHLGLPSPWGVVRWGGAGVELFFVLSGFLITGILLNAREKIEAGRETRGDAVRLFYIRRCLRIFPIYYLTLFIVAGIGIGAARSTLPWHLAYLSNVYFALHGWNGAISHLWSLSVEEQFYLLWPWLILFLPRRVLPQVILGAITVGPLFRLICVALGVNEIAIEVLPFGCLDLLAFGALLAHFRRGGEPLPRWLPVAAAIALPLAVVLEVSRLYDVAVPPEIVLGRVMRGLFFGWVVARAADGFGGITGTILELKPLAAIGRVSYAIYLFHNFANELARKFFQYALAMPFPESPAVQRLITVGGTLAAAAISWRYFEGPINRFKERFHVPPTPLHEPAEAAR
jgi:peptidoglycan/LPS O-acetylase OafA/YrhL